ncbi:RsiV family protein [Treponema primitia]|uniref:RsiV family protein n=1 Tax=Treponema primitia TaxID=88058 RepID=UPI0005704E02|nr:RsiV family protein [Treponema primitia]
MKTKQLQRTIQLALLCFLTLFSAACTSTGSAVSGGSSREARDYIPLYSQRTVFLYPGAPDTSPKMDIALSLFDITASGKRFILDILYEGQNADEYANKRLYGYDKMYGEMRLVAERIPDMPREALNWFYNEAFKFSAGTSKVTVISREWEYYTGGAHGMRNRDYYVFSLDEKRQLTLNDILREDTKSDLNDLVEAALRKLMEIPDWIPLSEQGFFENSVDKLEDFFLNSQGLGFQWDPYEIAPYVMGLIEIVIPFDQLEGLFTERGLSLTKDFR